MQISSSRSWTMLLPLGAVLLLAVLWTIYWLVASGIAQARFAEERAKRAAEGLTLGCTEEEWGGYPFHLEFTCKDPMLKLEGGGEIASSRVLLTALAYAPWQVVALLDGPSTIRVRGADPATVEHHRAIAAFTLGRNGRGVEVSAELPSVSVQGWGRAAQVMLHTRPAEASGTDVAITVKGVNHEPPGRPAIVVDDGELSGTLSPDGSLKIDRFSLQQRQVRYWGSGTVGLDPERRPSGKLDTQTNDLDGMLALVEPHVQLDEQNKSALRSILGLLGNEAKAPLIAREGVLYLGPFKITDLRPLY